MQGASEQQRDMEPPDEAPKTHKQRQSIGLRWLTAVILMPIILAFALLGGWWAFGITLLVFVLCVLELHTMFLHAGYHPLLWASFGLGTLFLLAAMLPPWRLPIIEVTLVIAVLVVFPSMFFRQKFEGAMVDWALTLASSIYLGWSLSFFLLLRGYASGIMYNAMHGIALSLPRGMVWLLVVLLGGWGFDSAAFFCGRYFGRHKLAPRISPAKSWEGVLGGLVLSIVASLILTVVPLGVHWYLAILLGVLIGVAAVLGDLTESLIKRQTHVKDSGQIMPGHGGMLDRVDSMLFAVIVVYIFALFVGR